MTSPLNRFRGFPCDAGLLVLDELTGEVVLVPVEGEPRVLRSGGPTTYGGHLPATAEASPPAPWLGGELPEKVRGMPAPIATTYHHFLEERDPRQRCRLLVDTFTFVLKTWALTLASQYLRSPVRDAQLNEMLSRDFQRPLISVWHLFSVRALQAFRDAGIEPFLRELPAAYDQLELRCQSFFLAETPYEDAHGQLRTRTSKLGKVQALIKLRNGLAHGSDLPLPRAHELLALYTPVLDEVLDRARFLSRYRFEKSEALALVADDGRLLEVEPLFERGESREDVLLFDGNTRSTLIYAGPRAAHVERQGRTASWRALLAQKTTDALVLRLSDLSLDALRTAAARVTAASMNELVASGRYLPGVVVLPRAVTRPIGELVASDCRGLVFSGASGSGKTTLLAEHALRNAQRGDVVLLYRAAALAGSDLQSRVLRDLGLRDTFLEDFLSSASPAFSDAGARLWVLLDGLNEHPGDVGLLAASLDALVRQANDFPWLRVMATMGAGTWERLPAESRFGRLEGARYFGTEQRAGAQVRRVPYVPIGELEEDEVATLYARYREHRVETEAREARVFRPLTPFEELGGGSTATLMRNPLMLRLLAATYSGRAMPRDLSWDEAMRMYFEQVVVAEHDPAGPFFERGALLRAIAGELDAAGADAIARDDLYEVPALRRALQNAQSDSAYAQLLDVGALTETWDGERTLIRFQSPRLLEHLLADQHEGVCRDAIGVLGLARRAVKFESLGGALVTLLGRAARAGRTSIVGEALARAGSGPSAAQLVDATRRLFEQLVRTGDPAAAAVVDALTERPSADGARALLSAFDGLFAAGEIAAAHGAANAARSIGEQLGASVLVAAAEFRMALLAQHRGLLDAALTSLARVDELATAAGELVLVERARVRRAEILAMRGRNAEASELLAEACEKLHRGGALADAAEARRQQAIALQRGDPDRAFALAKSAVDWADESGEPAARAATRITVGTSAWPLGEVDVAVSRWNQALEIASRAGLTRTVVAALSNLGVVERERGRLDAAVDYARRLLAFAERVDEPRLVSIALGNLGSYELEAGRLHEAEAALRRAADIHGALTLFGEQANAFLTLSHVASLLRSADADALLARADDLASRHHNQDVATSCAWLRAARAIAAGRRDVDAEQLLVQRAGAHPSRLRAAQMRAFALVDVAESGDAARTASLAVELHAELRAIRPLPELLELPTPPLLLAARRLVAAGQVEQGRALARGARDLLAGRPIHEADELEVLAGSTSDGATTASA